MASVFPNATTNGVNDVLRPLSTMAERVGKEVEEFAVRMDKWRVEMEKQDLTSERGYRETMDLVDQLTKIAEERLKDLKREASRNHSRSVTRSQVGSAGPRSEETRHELRSAQIEVNTWKLFRMMLGFEFPDPRFDRNTNRQIYLHQSGPLNTYTPGSEIWARFLLENDDAREMENIIRWLEETARTNGGSMEDILEELESKSGKGTSQWDKGWMDTREKLKGEKRIRLWDMPSSAGSQPHNDGEGRRLVTQLDPDAPSRQGRVLEPNDMESEKPIWETCFRLLRSGVPWDDVRGWFEERGEQWRAATLGKIGETQQCKTNTAGPDCGALWRRICFRIAQASGVPTHERAVYGLLAGDLESAFSQCRDWDDFLYVHYNAFLLSRFEKYLRESGIFQDRQISLPDETLPPASALVAFEDEGTVGGNTVRRLRLQPETEKEALEPEKNIQGALIGRQLMEFITSVGIAVSQNVYAAGRQSRLVKPTEVQVDSSFGAIADDETSLRLITHIGLIYQAFQPVYDENEKQTVDNICVVYMDYLRRAGKIDLLPTYASFIQDLRAEKVLGMIMADVTAPHEQRTLLNLIGRTHLTAPHALVEEYMWALDSANLMCEQTTGISNFKILESTQGADFPEQRVGASFTPHVLAPEEEKIIRSCEWFVLTPGYMSGVLTSLTYVYKCLLYNGRWSAALALSHRITWKNLMDLKTPYYYNGKRVDIMDDATLNTNHVEEMRRTTRAASRQPHPSAMKNGDQSSREEKFTRLYKMEGRTYYELMQLTLALEALSIWRKKEDEALATDLDSAMYEGAVPFQDARNALKKAFHNVCSAVEPVFHDFLTHSNDDEDAEWMKTIRHAYLPEVIIAYNAVLHFGGTYLGRENFTKSLDIATLITSEENKELVEALLSTGRMEELVRSLALTSKQLLKCNELVAKNEAAGRKRKASRDMGRKRGWDGRTAEIWDLGKLN
ncbi:hypothetical protein NA57DRAFT_31895 [Rhizodiscina lignyota]|uniref:Nuclear pore complex protein n=1 Tax=Rhizodiscina lignyota TaxID=1504668 RepID=A0A9P4IRH5_9PEZI|nr:hypothetical protein NA57DRAFT_31895 [Rhizodiscina lignyota]